MMSLYSFAVALTIAVMVNSPTLRGQAYNLTELGILPGYSTSAARALNAQGEIVGVSEGPNRATHSFLWRNSTLSDLTPLSPGIAVAAAGINNQSVIVGTHYPSGPRVRGFIWMNGAITDPFGQPDVLPVAISASGSIAYTQILNVGNCAPGTQFAAYRWKNGIATNVVGSIAVGINDNDLILSNTTRSGGNCPGGYEHGILSDGTHLAPDGVTFLARGINNRRQIIGDLLNNGVSRSAVWENGTFKELGTLGGTSSTARSINNFGEVVGMSQTATGAWRPFIYSQGAMIDLSQHILNSTLLEITELADINDSGWIVGTASSPTQPSRAVLLKPIANELTPTRGGNTGFVTVRAVLPGMMSGLTAKLSTSSGPDIVGTNTSVAFGILTTTFDLRTAPSGKRDFVINNPDLTSARIVEGFLVEQGGSAELSISKTGTRPVPGRRLDYFIVVENRGNTNTTNANVSEFLEDSFSLLEVTPPATADTATMQNGRKIIWNVGVLAPGEMRLLRYTAGLGAATPLGSIVTGGPACLNVDYGCIYNLVSAGACGSITTLTCLACAILCLPDTVSSGDFAPCGFCLARCGVTAFGCGVAFSGLLKSCTGPCAEKRDVVVAPVDPNEKCVAAGRYIRPDQRLVYPIHYENVGNAEARDVFIKDVLDPSLDTATIEILTPGATFDEATRSVKWSLHNKNLPPKGTDNVVLSIKPRPNLPSGVEIRNKATIQFEIFAPLTTNETVNIIDATAPVCTVKPLPAQTAGTTVQVSWNTSDAVGEVDTVSVFVAVNNGPFSALVQNTKEIAVNYTGSIGNKYSFYCTATDTVGNSEIQAPAAEASTILVPGGIPGDINGDGAVTCDDIALVRAAFGKKSGQSGFDARADTVADGVIDIRDLAYVSQRLPAGTRCN